MNNRELFREVLTKTRTDWGLNKEQFAILLDINVRDLKRYEAGDTYPTWKRYIELQHKVPTLANIPYASQRDLGVSMSMTVSDEGIKLNISGEAALWRDDAKFDALIAQIRLKRAGGVGFYGLSWECDGGDDD